MDSKIQSANEMAAGAMVGGMGYSRRSSKDIVFKFWIVGVTSILFSKPLSFLSKQRSWYWDLPLMVAKQSSGALQKQLERREWGQAHAQRNELVCLSPCWTFWVKEETSEPPKVASESLTEPQQHPELTRTFAAPTGTSSSRQQQLNPPPNYTHCHSPRAQTGFSPFLDHQ